MLGIGVLIGVFVILGFFLSWIANVVADEDMEIKTGFFIVVTGGILSLLIGVGLTVALGSIALFIQPFTTFGLYMLAIKVFGNLSWKHSAIVAAICSAIIFLCGLGLRSCAA